MVFWENTGLLGANLVAYGTYTVVFFVNALVIWANILIYIYIFLSGFLGKIQFNFAKVQSFWGQIQCYLGANVVVFGTNAGVFGDNKVVVKVIYSGIGGKYSGFFLETTVIFVGKYSGFGGKYRGILGIYSSIW